MVGGDLQKQGAGEGCLTPALPQIHCVALGTCERDPRIALPKRVLSIGCSDHVGSVGCKATEIAPICMEPGTVILSVKPGEKSAGRGGKIHDLGTTAGTRVPHG